MDDVGIVGQLAVLGIFTFIIVIGFYVIMVKKYYQSKIKMDEMKIIFLAIIIYQLLSIATLIIFDQQRIVLLPVILALFDYYCGDKKDMSNNSLSLSK